MISCCANFLTKLKVILYEMVIYIILILFRNIAYTSKYYWGKFTWFLKNLRETTLFCAQKHF